jgi:hypothetical protein
MVLHCLIRSILSWRIIVNHEHGNPHPLQKRCIEESVNLMQPELISGHLNGRVRGLLRKLVVEPLVDRAERQLSQPTAAAGTRRPRTMSNMPRVYTTNKSGTGSRRRMSRMATIMSTANMARNLLPPSRGYWGSSHWGSWDRCGIAVAIDAVKVHHV